MDPTIRQTEILRSRLYDLFNMNAENQLIDMSGDRRIIILNFDALIFTWLVKKNENENKSII